ncbi:sensory transduction histidine kinase [Methanosarcina lacustris Z-7289]|uniref:histidine kinase n=1 Tax=Methanosarcina lacustris Z-7289 TaxID=1434111 RepID=A0A0E3S3M2_9EURY|nr:PAS domain S-box protein [Methanosarcina lacustris]AKB75574.1 sensory transduction histidine kinase [Methanosarcina lacustris Z-7289]
MEQFTANNPNPVLRARKDGTVLYSNMAGEPLLHEWGMVVGGKLPTDITYFIQKVISQNIPGKTEVELGNSKYIIAFYPLPEEECVDMYGFNICEQKETETLLREANEQIQIQSEELNVSNEELRAQADELHEYNKLLHDSETGFRTLAENSPDLIVRFDRQNHCLYSNPAVAKLYGIPRIAEFYGWSASEFIDKTNSKLRMDPEVAKFSEKQRENVFITGKSETVESKYKSSQGEEYYFNTQIVPEFTDGEVISVLAISRDITDIKKVETKLNEMLYNLEEKVKERTAELEKAYSSLLENERRFSEAQKVAHIGNWDWNIITNKLYISDEVYRIYGCEPQELSVIRNAFLSYLHPDDRDFVDNTHKKALNGRPYSIDYRIILANGEEHIVHEQGKVIFDKENIPVQMRGTVQDITKRKKSEEKIKNLADIVESSNDAIGTLSLDEVITGWNKGAEQVYGYSAKEILGKSISILELDNCKGKIKQLIEKIKQGEKIRHYETSRLKMDGTTINVSVTRSPIFDQSGKFVAISFIDRDITEKKIAEKLHQEMQMAEVANRAKSDFLANMSHELRTPLNSIIGFSDLLFEQAYGELNKKQLRSVGNISRSGKHLLNLINDILDISKIEAGKMELDYQNFELATKLDMIRNILFPIADKNNIKIEIDMDSKLTSICADEDKFIQIMYNLVNNAIKFSYENSFVKIGARKKGDLVEITVKDTGIGIKVEDQYKLFKPFSQIDSFSSRKFQGTGLGLSLVKQIVHLHGGYVWFRSNPSEGSTFAFAIPINNNKGNSGYVELDQNA